MEALELSCLLYVHDRWGKTEQRGLLVAGKPTEKFGDSIIKSYKIVDGEFVSWPAEERTRGPVLHQWRKSYLRGGGMECTNSG